MEKVIRIFPNLEEAEKADWEYYRALSPQQRLDLAFEIYDEYYDAGAQRLERVCRVLKRGER